MEKLVEFKSKMLRATSSGFKYRLGFIGAVVGIIFIVVAIVTDRLTGENTTTGLGEYLINLYQTNPVHWIVMSAPFVLGFAFYHFGNMVSEREALMKEQINKEKVQFTLLEEFIGALENNHFDQRVSERFENKGLATQLERFRDKLLEGKRTEELRLWENEGLARFSDLLRRFSEVNQLTEEVIRFIVKYLACNQGSIFVLSENDNEVLELKATYAYDKKKFVGKSLNAGEGLVGQCFLEKETIVLFDVPQNYIKITSGLGTANPDCVVIVPLKYNDVVAGVMEVASFNRMEQYQISFLEKCAAALASVIQASRVNDNVKRLLHDSQQQTEELRTQEEEMRQNVEELQSIQEQISRQLEENVKMKNQLQAREDVLALTTILSESDLHGTITFVNKKFIEVSRYKAEELIGKGHNLLRHPDMPKQLFAMLWATIKKGKPFHGIVKNRKKDGTSYWVDATIVPIFEDGKIVKYIGARYHITNEDIAQHLYDQQMERLGLRELVE